MSVAANYITLPPATPVVDANPVIAGIPIGAYSKQLGVATAPPGWPALAWSSWAITGGNLPSGFSLSTNGLLVGTFTAGGTFSAEITVTAGTSSPQALTPLVRTYSFTVDAGTPPLPPKTHVIPLLTRTDIPNAQISAPFVQTLGLASMPYAPGAYFTAPVWALAENTLPAGASLNSSTGVLTVTFTSAGNYLANVTITSTSALFVVDPLIVSFSFTAVASGGSGGTTTTPPPPAPVTPPVTPPPPPAPVITVTQSVTTDEWILSKTAADNGEGLLEPTQNGAGRIDYANANVYFPVTDLFLYKKWNKNEGSWTQEEITDSFGSGAQVSITYLPADAITETAIELLPAQKLLVNLKPYSTDTIVPGTVQFRVGSTIYQDNEGIISHTVSAITGVGTPCGTLDYLTGIVELSSWVAGSPTFTLLSLATMRGTFTETEFYFRTAGSPLRPAGFQIAATALDGELIVASALARGELISTDAVGTVDAEFGLVDVQFGAMVLDSSLTTEEKLEDWYDIADVDEDGYIWKPRKVIPQTARYNAVIYSYLPLPASLLGLNPVRLPMDGRVPFCRPGDSAIIHHTATFTLPNPAIGAATYSVGRTSLARLWIRDATGRTVPGGIGGKYSANLDTGVITMAIALDLTDYTQPLTAYHMIAAEGLIADVDVSGQVKLASAIQQAFPLGSYLSTELRIGDLGARVSVPFSQQSWTGVWSDIRIGNAIAPQFAHSLYPIVVTNDGAAQERWRLPFVTATTVDVIGESLGVIATGLSILADIAPINPVTGNPYFTIPYQGWGAGWISGYLLRHNTYAADYPIAVLRCVQQGPAGASADRLGIEFLGDVDA